MKILKPLLRRCSACAGSGTQYKPGQGVVNCGSCGGSGN